VLADPVGECVQGELLHGELGGESGQGGGVAGAVTVFVDDGAQRRVAVEGDSGDAGVLGDGDEGDRLAVSGQLGAGLLDLADPKNRGTPTGTMHHRAAREAIDIPSGRCLRTGRPLPLEPGIGS
jgi:hypothetical protein